MYVCIFALSKKYYSDLSKYSNSNYLCVKNDGNKTKVYFNIEEFKI